MASSTSDLFPPKEDFPDGECPTKFDVIAYAKYLSSKSKKRYKKLCDPDIVSKVSEKVLDTWTSANPCFAGLVRTQKTVCTLVKRLLEDSNNLVWSKKDKDWREEFKLKLRDLFEVLRCSSQIFGCSLLLCEKTSFPPDTAQCGPGGAGTHYTCVCGEKSNKIPSKMLDFVRAQRSKVNGSSSVKIEDVKNIDVTPQAERKRQAQRESAEAKRRKSLEEDEIFKSQLDDIFAALTDDSDSDSDLEDDSDSEYVPSITFTFNGQKMSSKNMVTLRAVAIIADKYEMSDREVAALVTACLVDFGLVSEEHCHLVVDRMKVRRAREKVREESKGERKENAKTITAILADGKTSKEHMAQKKVGGKNVKCKGSWSKNITITTEPESQYFSHFQITEKATIERPASLIFCEEMLKEFKRCGGLLENLQVFGSDSENAMSGHLGGVIRWKELLLGRKILYFVCMLHLNELPYKALFKDLDGPTKSKSTYSGPIGKLLPTAEQMPFNADFVPLNGPPLMELHPDVQKALTKDVQDLYKFANLVNNGEDVRNVDELSLGHLHEARWFNNATRNLRVFVSQHQLADEDVKNLKMICEYICWVYLPTHLDVIKCPLLTEGARHCFRLVERLRLVAPEIQVIVKNNLKRNSFYFHSELLLMCLLTSSDLEEREFAVKIILEIRKKAGNEDEGDDSAKIRKYPRDINFEAQKLIDIIPHKLYTSEPSYTCSMRKVDLLKVITDGLSVPPWPCHTRSVEQAVQKVHKAIQVVSSKEAADGLILNQQLGCALVSKNESKKDLVGLCKATTMSYKDSIKKK